MTRLVWKHAVLCSVLVVSTTCTLAAQNATSGGDQMAQRMRRRQISPLVLVVLLVLVGRADGARVACAAQ